MNTSINTTLVVELFEQLKEQNIAIKKIIATQGEQLEEMVGQNEQANDELLRSLGELAADLSERPVSTPAPRQVVREVVYQLPDPLPEQVLRHKHSLDMKGVRAVAVFAVTCFAAVVFGYLYVATAFEVSAYKDSDTKYRYVLANGSVDSTTLQHLEALFNDPEQSDRRAELETYLNHF